MSESKTRLSPAAQLRPALPRSPSSAPAAGAVAGAGAAGSSGRTRTAARRCSSRATSPRRARGHALQQQTERLREQARVAAVQSALAAGDLRRGRAPAPARLGRTSSGEVLPPDLRGRVRRACRRPASARLAVAEAALAANAPVARGSARTAVRSCCWPHRRKVGDRLVGVAYVRLPLTLATDAVAGGQRRRRQLPGAAPGQLHRARARRHRAWPTSAEALAARSPAPTCASPPACPTRPQGAFGLGAIPSLVAAAGAARAGLRAVAGDAARPGLARRRRPTTCGSRGADAGAGHAAGAAAARGRRRRSTPSHGSAARRRRSRSTAASSAPTTSAASSARRSTPASRERSARRSAR